MNARLTILLAGLILLATSIPAMAHGGDRHDYGRRHYQSWVKGPQHADHYRPGQRHGDHWRHSRIRKEVRRQVKRELRHERKERRHYARQHHHRPHRVKVEPATAVLLGFPRLVFRIDL